MHRNVLESEANAHASADVQESRSRAYKMATPRFECFLMRYGHRAQAPGWNILNHYGACGQNCPCCRAASGDLNGSCQVCEQVPHLDPLVRTLLAFAPPCLVLQGGSTTTSTMVVAFLCLTQKMCRSFPRVCRRALLEFLAGERVNGAMVCSAWLSRRRWYVLPVCQREQPPLP